MKALASMDVRLRTPKDFGAAIRARRRLLGWGQAELAKRVGVSRLWVNQVESGKPGAGLGLVLRTLGALGLTLKAGASGEINVESQATAPAAAVDLEDVLRTTRKKSSWPS
ncbi:MAG: helix-turn-helix domain-containing protein [Tagaea sp.]|nr:helix-turn-helix domain-containing protein [Tagaea sp.]